MIKDGYSSDNQADAQAKSEQDRSKPRILVFCNKVKTVRFVHTLCLDAGFKAAMLHGERSQAEREVCASHFTLHSALPPEINPQPVPDCTSDCLAWKF